jgi:glycerol uptake facilitator-like aquaporin
MFNKYLAEGIGTFTLAFIVLAASSFNGVMPMPVPLIAGITLMLFVYTIGPISGSHINPAVTTGLWSVGKIATPEALRYIVAQLAGALLAILCAKLFLIKSPLGAPAAIFDISVFMAEALGAFFFAFGIASVVYEKVREQMSGVVVGFSLVLGVLVSVFAGAAGILNPAVAMTLNVVTITYIVAPMIGAVLGFQAYRFLIGVK